MQFNEWNEHFENLIFAGGSVKGIAYVGAIAVLEELGLLDKVISHFH